VRIATRALVGLMVLAAMGTQQAAQAAFMGMPRALAPLIKRIPVEEQTLGPMAHTRFCIEYPAECSVRRMAFRGGALALTPERWSALVEVNNAVNRAIKPEPNHKGVAGEVWLVSPRSGDCNDYAVTKRHQLLARGWPSRSLLLAEVVTTWGEHHLVLVIRSQDGDLVADNLNPTIRPWSKTGYQWVRIQTPGNPVFWSKAGRGVA
jgi:predicted transglutaminase-like cysteine proteinase